jgi:hypothetical protein
MTAAEQPRLLEQFQRMQVQIEQYGSEKHVKIRMERHDDKLGWYTAGSISIPLCQLPLLEQAVAEMRAWERAEEASKIIPFPGCAAG